MEFTNHDFEYFCGSERIYVETFNNGLIRISSLREDDYGEETIYSLDAINTHKLLKDYDFNHLKNLIINKNRDEIAELLKQMKIDFTVYTC